RLHAVTWFFYFFYFNDRAPTDIYTLSLHDALPIWRNPAGARTARKTVATTGSSSIASTSGRPPSASTWPIRPMLSSRRPRSSGRSEEHTSELQSRGHLVCRLLLEKKKCGRYRLAS